MPSIQHSFFRLSVEKLQGAFSTRFDQIASLRKVLDTSASTLNLPRGVKAQPVEIAGMQAEWLIPRVADAGHVILFIHGGGYAVGSLATHRSLAGKLAKMSRCKALIIDYRLAPEHPFPAALEDAVHAYQWLIGEKYTADQIVLVGDSAGGGLCMSLQVCLKKMNYPLPAASVLFSPWVDLTFSGESAETHQIDDPIVIVDHVKEWASSYAHRHSILHPMISPLYADLSGLSPVLIQASDAEVLTDDAVRLARKLASAGTESHLQLYPELLHVWQILWPFLPEAKEALSLAADFIEKQIEVAEVNREGLEELEQIQDDPKDLGFKVAV